MAQTFSPKEAALYVSHATGRSVTAKQLRSFIRACDDRGEPIVAPVGSGARYVFTSDEVHALAAAYERRPITSGTPSVRSLDTLLALLDDNGDNGDDVA
jgi:hypothetical protein